MLGAGKLATDFCKVLVGTHATLTDLVGLVDADQFRVGEKIHNREVI